MFTTTAHTEDDVVAETVNVNVTTAKQKFYHLESSLVDWCEENFIVSSHVAEFFNTLSNTPFLLLPPILGYLFRGYTKQVGIGANLVFLLFFVVGVGSAYFHWTLSVAGQMVDQLAIIWVLLAGFTIWFPKRYLPPVFLGDRCAFRKMIMLPLIITITCISFIRPSANTIIMMLMAAPVIAKLIDEYRSDQNWRVRSLAIRCAIEWCFAMVLWINDKFLCDLFWYHFPYLHSGWHLMICISAYHACVLFCYFEVTREQLQLSAELRYWPKDGKLWQLICLPYVEVKEKSPTLVKFMDGDDDSSSETRLLTITDF